MAKNTKYKKLQFVFITPRPTNGLHPHFGNHWGREMNKFYFNFAASAALIVYMNQIFEVKQQTSALDVQDI